MLETSGANLPHAPEAERSVLGAVLLDNGQFDRARELLTGQQFYSERHRKIFDALEHLSETGSALDLVTLKDELERQNTLEACGGPAYLAALIDGVPRSSNVEHYARIVQEKALLRELIRTSQQILSAAVQADEPTETLLDEAEKAIFSVAEQRLGSGFIPLKTSAEEAFKHIQELTERQELITGVASGFPHLDEKTAGFQPSDLIILAARPSMGKTALALNLAAHAGVHNGQRVGVFSLEMSHQQLFMRLLCAEAKIDAHRLRTGRIGKEQWQDIIRVYGPLSEAPVFIDDTPGVSVMEMRAKARRLKREHGLDLLIVDYLQLMRGNGRYDSRQQEISDISRSLKALAKELNVPVIALSQLSRAPEQRGGDHRPQLSDLRESGAIEQDADVVMFLFREEVYKRDDPDLEGKAELIIGKQRNGPTGTVELNFIRQFTRFTTPEFREF
ncbi:MAG: replicative DNA helicase [Acidobacteria bacterium]|nr:replicative DNA helicase [Acidobacteriota bacterium]NIM61011.1 replicative DNA helicase [Acidobacteriota bacterium]NIO59979.1 replicative DNA helicase [Acidobacteriota bacterium]NIQ31051.1 replicative DNA helicase [Acidobacteriota bacterium]NIQ86179.1 replicative DNA helicase [Acidobacteriota bacterium]